VSITEGQQLALSFGCPFFESSALEGVSVEEPFYDLVRKIRSRTKGRGKEATKKSPGTLGCLEVTKCLIL
jgi:GTPase KRas protein